MITIGNNNFLNLEDIAKDFSTDLSALTAALDKEQIKYVYLANTPYVLETEFLKLFKEPNEHSMEPQKCITEPKKRYPVTEKEIMEETIKYLNQVKSVSIKELREYLKENMALAEEDYQINKGRNDTKFDQKVRNLVSHRETNGLNMYCNYEDGCLSIKED